MLPGLELWAGNAYNRAFLRSAVAGQDVVINLVGILNEPGRDGSGFELGGAATVYFAKNWSASLGYTGDIRSGEKLASRVSLSLQTGF